MREILFRGKIMPNGRDRVDRWHYGSLVNKHRYYTITAPYSSNDPIMNEWIVDVDTVGQYSGRTDFNHNRVFEGDIINRRGCEFIGIVRFGNHPPHLSLLEETGTGFYIDWQGERRGTLRTDLGYWLDRGESVVIGNIHDNPELLREDETHAGDTGDH